jgi:diguanylate cyclase (GGDEF)-like protein/PAS domain S-box-containing protein
MWWFLLLFALALSITGWVIYSLVRETVEENIRIELTSSTEAIRTMVRNTADVSIRTHLQAIAVNNLAILKGFDQQIKRGEITEKAAKELSMNILLSQTIGQTGYTYVLTGKGILAVHPNEKLKNLDISSQWISQKQQEKKEGYLEYEWKNPGEDHERPKALYMVYFKSWDWIISVSSYRDEFKTLLNIDDFKAGINSFNLGTRGYAYILSGQGEIILHPMLSGVVHEQTIQNRSHLTQMLQEKNGQLNYRLQESGETHQREKIVIYKYIPELDWIVASAAYLDEIHKPLLRLRNIILSTIIITLSLILPLSFYLGTAITRPITLLTRRMSSAAEGDYDVLAEENALGEVGILARHFNNYMARLKRSTEQLENEISDRIRVEQQLKLFAKVFENALEGISITDAEGNIIAVNQSFSDITGYKVSDVLYKNSRILKSKRHGNVFYKEMWKSLLEKGSWTGEIWNRRANGEAYPEILSISSICNSNNEVTNYVAVFHDITDMKLKEEQITHQAFHDALTGLPNRFLAKDRLTMSMTNAKRKKNQVAVFYMDLDNFKHVNDSLGHPLGDLLLQQVGKRLLTLVREEDTVARLGGDEFQIIGIDISSIEEVINMADRLLQGFSSPFKIETHELFVTLSIGIAIYPQDGKSSDILIKNADVAMYQAKLQGKNNYFLFTSELSERAIFRLKLEAELRQALLQKEFIVYYQPKVKPENGIIMGVEALVRWQKPDGTIVSPNDFIPLAEETGLITRLGILVLEQACEAMQILNNIGCKDIKMSVNLSPFQFEQANLVESILSIVAEKKMPVSQLELEITETTMMTNLKDTIAKLHLLVDAGMSVSIDDFGTGYSSLYYLKTFPINTLKIDRSFIKDITTDANGAQIVETIILMAHNLGIGVVAEGVETKEQLDLLQNFGCDLIQGYYYSPPLPLKGLVEYLKTTMDS